VGVTVDQGSAGFREFVVARSASLARTAYLLTGDRQLAEDLVQEALTRVASTGC
jgi:DNA-directed RNA polymerase specialized sigma24 family protein